MAAALLLFLNVCLLGGALCGQFQAVVPQTIEVLKGSCVTIPCSFDIPDNLNENLDSTCKALWQYLKANTVFDSSNPQQREIKGELVGDLIQKDCTTTLNVMKTQYSRSYFFRIDCGRALRYSFADFPTNISVRGDLGRPTLTPPTLKVKEGTSVSLTCSAPAPCLLLPPNLTWTPGLGEGQETLQENQDKTKVKVSVLTFTASHLHHRQQITCTAVYGKQDGSTELSVSTTLTTDVTFAPRILSSSLCTRTVNQVNCSCKTSGNPPPTLLWTLDGSPVNHSDKFAISYEHHSGTNVSFITMSHPQRGNQFTLRCHSSNSLGSASQLFYLYGLEPKTNKESQDFVIMPIFMATIVTLLVLILALLALVCALLCHIRAQKIPHNLLQKQNTDNASTVTMSQLLPSGEGNEEPIKTVEDIYANASMLRKPDVSEPPTISAADSTNMPSSTKNNAEEFTKSSDNKNEEDKDVVYTTVTWRSKGEKEGQDSGVTNLSGNSDQQDKKYTEEGSCGEFVCNAMEVENLYDNVKPGDVNKESESEYALVKYKDNSDLQQ